VLGQQQDTSREPDLAGRRRGVGEGEQRIQPVGVGGTAIRPSAEYGYVDRGSSTITTCSPAQSVANPAASAAAATARMISGLAPVPIPSACSPMRMSAPVSVSPPPLC